MMTNDIKLARVDDVTISDVIGSLSSNIAGAEPYDGAKFELKTFEEFLKAVNEKKYTEDYIRRIINYYCEELDIITDKIKEKGLQNEQWALDGMDRLNKISVKF